MVCADMKDIILPDIKIGRRTYGHETQMELVLSIEKYMVANPGKTYCGEHTYNNVIRILFND